MSKISLKPNSAGSANFEIAAPATNVDRTFNLPDEAGTVLTDVSDIESQVKTATNATGTAPIYACRSWVNFDGTGTVAIRDSGNVSSITDLGTGNYQVNFSNAMPDANYCALFTAGRPDNTSSGDRLFAIAGFLTTSVNVSVFNSGVGALDSPTVCCAIFR